MNFENAALDLVDYANLRYANPRKLHIALVVGLCYNIFT